MRRPFFSLLQVLRPQSPYLCAGKDWRNHTQQSKSYYKRTFSLQLYDVLRAKNLVTDYTLLGRSHKGVRTGLANDMGAWLHY